MASQKRRKNNKKICKNLITILYSKYFNVVGASSTKKIGEIDKSNDHLFKNIAMEYFKIKPKLKFMVITLIL